MKRTYAPDWKPQKRRKNAKAVEAKRVPNCRVCGAKQAGISVHHIVPRSQGGDDVPANCVSLCGHGTTGCHGLIEAHDKTARSQLRANLLTDEIGYVIAKKSRVYLDEHYPKAAA